MKQEFRNRVVCDQDVYPTVVIVVGDGHAQSFARLVDTRLVRYLGELAVAIVVIEENRSGLEDVGVAIGTITGFVLATIDVIKVPLHITGNHQVEAAVIVVVHPGGAGRPAGTGYPRAIGHVSKGAIPIVVIEGAAPITGDE